MSVNKVYKFNNTVEMQYFLNGAVFGGDVSQGADGLVGKTLTFDSPSGAVTFTTGSNADNPYRLSFAEIKAQIEDDVTGLLVTTFNGRIVFVEESPSAGVSLSNNDEPAKSILGYARNNVAGKVYTPPGVTPGSAQWVAASSGTDGSCTIFTWE